MEDVGPAGMVVGVEVVLRGVVGVWVGLEAPVEHGGRGVDVDFARADAGGRGGGAAGLRGDVADGAVEGGVYEFGVVFV